MNLNQSDVRTCNHYVQNLYFVALLFSTWMYHHKKICLWLLFIHLISRNKTVPKKKLIIFSIVAMLFIQFVSTRYWIVFVSDILQPFFYKQQYYQSTESTMHNNNIHYYSSQTISFSSVWIWSSWNKYLDNGFDPQPDHGTNFRSCLV